jgi:glycosyltransferase involved in cell wall biosynthesis
LRIWLVSIAAMRRVLMLARQFPPIGGAGVHRTLGSVRHLSSFGYEPIVVTGPASRRDRWEPPDPDLLERIPADVAVHRLEGAEPSGSPSRLARVLRAPAPWVRWWVRESARLALEVGRGVDVVYASCLPYETAFAAARVARTLGCPWVADLEDPWALDEMRPSYSRLHRALDVRQMRRALESAAAIVMSAPEAAERLRAALPELARRITVTAIPIGFDRTDFEAGALPPGGGPFRIVHTGSLHTALGRHVRRTRLRRRLLGGTAPGLDILTRSAVVIAEAIARDPELAASVELHLAGVLTPEDRDALHAYRFVRTPGLLDHREAVALMRSAGLLFLPMHDLPPGARAGLIPYKTYEYLAAARPILAAVPEGDVRDMLAARENTTIVRPSDVDGIAAAVRFWHEAAAAAPGGRVPDAEAPDDYDRVRSVARIAEVLDAVAGPVRTERRTSRSGR